MDPVPFSAAGQSKRFFTVMSRLPEDINREEIMSLLSATSKVRSLHLFCVHTAGKGAERLGLVEVADNEGLFRLTSRTFMIRRNRAVRHTAIDANSKLVQHFLRQKEIPLKLRFTASNRLAPGLVVDFFSQFGQLSMVSMRAQHGIHELTFRAASSYSLRQFSTDLTFEVEGTVVRVEYPEEQLSSEYFQHELDMRCDLYSTASPSLKPAHTRATFFTSPASADSSFSTPADLSRDLKATVGLLNREYVINGDDALSALSEEEGSDDEAVAWNHPRLSNFKYFDLKGVHPPRSPPLAFFAGSSASSLFDCWQPKPGAPSKNFSKLHHILSPSQQSRPATHKPRPQQHQLQVSPAHQHIHATKPQQANSSLAPAALNTNNSPLTAKQNKPARGSKKDSTAGKVLEKKPELSRGQLPKSSLELAPTSEAKPRTQPSRPKNSHQSSLNVKGLSSSDQPDIPEKAPRDGSVLLSLIWTEPPDLQELDARIMPELNAKWYRFIEIKDAMRREKYQEYLQNKKKDLLVQDCNNGHSDSERATGPA